MKTHFVVVVLISMFLHINSKNQYPSLSRPVKRLKWIKIIFSFLTVMLPITHIGTIFWTLRNCFRPLKILYLAWMDDGMVLSSNFLEIKSLARCQFNLSQQFSVIRIKLKVYCWTTTDLYSYYLQSLQRRSTGVCKYFRPESLLGLSEWKSVQNFVLKVRLVFQS